MVIRTKKVKPDTYVHPLSFSEFMETEEARKREYERRFVSDMVKKVYVQRKNKPSRLKNWFITRKAKAAVKQYKPRILTNTFEAMFRAGIAEDYIEQHALEISEILDKTIFDVFIRANLYKLKTGNDVVVFEPSIIHNVEDELFKRSCQEYGLAIGDLQHRADAAQLAQIDEVLDSRSKTPNQDKNIYI